MNITTEKLKGLRDYGAQIALILLIIAISILSPEFRTVNNALSLLRQSAVNGLIAFGMTFVILTGGIDLSVGSVLCLTALLCAGMIKAAVPVPAALLLAFALGIVLGFLNGLMIVKGRLQPFIATLVSMTAYRGIGMIYSNGRPVSDLGQSALLAGLGKGHFLGIPVPVWILLIVFFIFLFILQKTVFGRQVYAVGCNPKAAALAGISTGRVTYLVYVISGAAAAVAGLILVSRLGSAQPTMGSGYELDAIAAVALGGTSMSGGRGRILGTLTGVLIIAILNNGMNILGISSYYQQVVKALVILLAVLSDRKR
ncbi:ABC transporter permease subunit [Treponema brennaborense]|uniref:ABC-type transporter, integral membrane subunit n=1 Tax=Treponema brennaborense (strain DSM 12168 / CIP 105900 / DD5/3) TaxID=906968 RepID=F4LMF2_TREBD|nr:ribose ABC transporter permease [Treponema brennaborense]AEE15714.1 ABC-type transporter, integral membrane subunit [Treponema brennaborense DSM 12168]